MDLLRGLRDDLRHLDELLLSPWPQFRARGWMLGLAISLASAIITFLVARLL